MWCKRKLLLSAVLFTAFCSKVTKQSEMLDMAPDSVDDRYSGCRAKVYETINAGLLKEELNHSAEFRVSWNSAEECLKQTPGISKEHLRALSLHDGEEQQFLKTFNKAVKKLGANSKMYENQFHYKSLHFLLMDSMREQQPKNCKAVYAAPTQQFAAKNGSEVRLGRFLKASTNYEDFRKFEEFDDNVILNITSCFFAKLGADICSKDDAVLLSPAEVFTVMAAKPVKEKDSEYILITLKHAKVFSFHDCYVFSRSTADSATYWLVVGLAALATWSCLVFDC